MNTLRRRVTGITSASAVALLITLSLSPSSALAADGDEAPVTTESSAVEGAAPSPEEAAPDPATAADPALVAPPTDDAPNVPTPADQLQVANTQKLTTQTDTPKKVDVCKFVGTPGVDEQIQTGQNPISVSVNSIQNNQWDGTIPGYFSDAHDRSYVLGYTGEIPEGVSCPEPPPVVPGCIANPTFAYTYLEPTGSGVITVTGGKAGEVLCTPLFVRSVAWDYILPASGSPSWPQSKNGYNDTTVGTIGTFSYGPPQLADCHQYDTHASFVGYSELALPDILYGSHDPYEPPFLHEVLIGKGPNPTYSYTSSEGCNPPPLTPKVCTTIEDGPTATDVTPLGWNSHDTRTTGVSEFVDGGYHLQTTDTGNPGSSQNNATLYKSVTPTPLAEFGEPSVTFAGGGTGVKPGMQVGIDVDGDGDWDGYLVGKPWSYGAHNWWINKPGFNVPSGMGYTSFGSWADFVAANPDAMVIEVGLSLGSGVVGDWIVTSFVFDCTSYTYDKVEIVVVTPSATIDYDCVDEGSEVKGLADAGTSDTTFQFFVNGELVEEKLVLAGKEYVFTTTLAEDSSGGSATAEITAGDISLTGEVVVLTDCNESETVAPSATIACDCVTGGTEVTATAKAGTYNTTFQFFVNGKLVEEKLVLAGKEYVFTTTLAEDSSGGSATVEVKSGEITLTGEVVVSTDCKVPPTDTPKTPTSGNGIQAGADDMSGITQADIFTGVGYAAGFVLLAMLVAAGVTRLRRKNEYGVKKA